MEWLWPSFSGDGEPGSSGSIRPHPSSPSSPCSCSPFSSDSPWTMRCSCFQRCRKIIGAGTVTRKALCAGSRPRGGVITSAAAIMIVVFTGFVLGDDIAIKQVGLGLAVAILVDATLVRVLLVPSTMVVIGDANWWMPGGLARFIGESGSSGNGDEGRRCRKGAWLG